MNNIINKLILYQTQVYEILRKNTPATSENFIFRNRSCVLTEFKQTFGVPVEPLVYMMMAVSSAVGLVSAVHSQMVSSFHLLLVLTLFGLHYLAVLWIRIWPPDPDP
jgi:hypothetical protein